MRGRRLLADRTLAAPLQERGLLRVLEPETFVDEEASTELTAVIEALVDEQALTGCPRSSSSLSCRCREWGHGTLHADAERISEKFQARGLCPSVAR
jgi:hypothetical protein